MKLNFRRIVSASLVFLCAIEAGSSDSTKRKDKSSKQQRDMVPYEPTEQFVSEEYSARTTFKAERVGPYQVIYMDRNIARVPESEYFHTKGRDKIKEETVEKRKPMKKSKRIKEKDNAYFHNDVETESDTSSVADEFPRTHPSVTETNARFSDFVSGRRTRLMHHLPIQLGGFDGPVVSDNSDVLASQVRAAIFFTSHDMEFDGFMTTSIKEEYIHLWRNGSIHPQRTYDENNEVDPLVPQYKSDVDTSQKDFESHFGRNVGRDKKKKTFPNRNSFSSVNDGCVIS